MGVPAYNVLGGAEGKGFVHLMQQLPQERLSIAVAAAAAECESAVRETAAYAHDRGAFGQNLLAIQNTRFVLAARVAGSWAARTMVDHCFAQHVTGDLDAPTASLAKFWCTDMRSQVADRCLQIFGGCDYMREYPIARGFAAARVRKIYGGSNEIMKELVARTL